jgi:methyl-accepting chemotaxis protein
MSGGPESTIAHWFAEHWGTLLTFSGAILGSVGFVVYTIKFTIPNVLKRLDLLEEVQKNLDRRADELGYAKRRRDLFDDKGLPLFQLRDGCLEMRGNCSGERAELKHDICKKMEEVKTQLAHNVRAIHETLNEQSEEAAQQADQIKDILSRVERIVEKDRQSERREEMLEMATVLGEKITESIVNKMKVSADKVGSGGR